MSREGSDSGSAHVWDRFAPPFSSFTAPTYVLNVFGGDLREQTLFDGDSSDDEPVDLREEAPKAKSKSSTKGKEGGGKGSVKQQQPKKKQEQQDQG